MRRYRSFPVSFAAALYHIHIHHVIYITSKQFRSLPSSQFRDYSFKPVRRILRRSVYQFKTWSKACDNKQELLIPSLTHLYDDEALNYFLLLTSEHLLLNRFRQCGQTNALCRISVVNSGSHFTLNRPEISPLLSSDLGLSEHFHLAG